LKKGFGNQKPFQRQYKCFLSFTNSAVDAGNSLQIFLTSNSVFIDVSQSLYLETYFSVVGLRVSFALLCCRVSQLIWKLCLSIR